MQLLLLHVFVGREPKDSVGVVAESLGLVESQELEESALVLLELHLQLNCTLGSATLQGLDASEVLPDEPLELS